VIDVLCELPRSSKLISRLIAVVTSIFITGERANGYRPWRRPELSARRVYDCRHTYATWSLRAGLNTFQLARRMGTTVEMIERTYGHLAIDSDDYEIGLLDTLDSQLRHEMGTEEPGE
jgi:integrase